MSNFKVTNRLLPSCLKPLFQSEAKSKDIDIKMIFFILMQIGLVFTLSLVWKQMVLGTQK